MKLSFNAYGIDNQLIYKYSDKVIKAHEQLNDGTGRGHEFLGWLSYESSFDQFLIDGIKLVATEIREKADVLLVLGIGGSYLGAKAVLEALGGSFKTAGVEVIFAGHHLNGEYMLELLEYVKTKSVYVNVISKSGTTLETALAFRMVKSMMKEKYPDDFNQRIIATTDADKGALRAYADSVGLRTFPIPDEIGGRYSVFTAVGLLPMAASGIEIEEVLMGLKKGIADFNEPILENNPAYYYAAARYVLYRFGKQIELFVTSQPKLTFLGEWLKQLFGESEGKEGKGIFPACAQFSTDLHSLGQWIQDGNRNIFETMVLIEEPEKELKIEFDLENLDGLNHLTGKSFDEMDKIMMRSAMKAHIGGDVPCLNIEIKRLDAFNLAYLMYFFMKACAVSGYLLGVNPFDQPGVEAYKNNMKNMMK
jgi:glucose-6-phosphate isomerase